MTSQKDGSETQCVTGDLKHFSIFDITQSLMMSRKTALVTVQHERKKGYVHFRDGQIISALDGDLNKGEKAAFKIFLWRGGLFRIDFDVQAQERNVNLDTENLLLEIARNMDENRRHRVPNSAPDDEEHEANTVETQFDDRFRNELNKVFQQVAQSASPSRDRYTVTAFDSLLLALNDLSGSALFLRPDCRPRIKTKTGFETVNQEVICSTEIEGFLNSLLAPAERDRFLREKEVSVYYSTESAGSFRLSAFFDYGRPACIFSPASRSIPPLAHLGGDAALLTPVLQNPCGLFLIVGPLSSGRTTLLASLIEEGLAAHDLLVALFSRTQTFQFSEDSGFIIRGDLDRFQLGIDGSLQSAVEQGADVIAVDEITGSTMFQDALTVASRTSLVVAILEADGMAEAVERIQGFLQGPRSDRLTRQLGRALLGFAEVDLAAAEGVSPIRSVPIDETLRAALSAGDLELLINPLARC